MRSVTRAEVTTVVTCSLLRVLHGWCVVCLRWYMTFQDTCMCAPLDERAL
jgi:hypothetical protein